ncbi:MAG: hypothetical protein ACW98J_08140 [Candidatus Thorarchaeota archaeon]
MVPYNKARKYGYYIDPIYERVIQEECRDAAETSLVMIINKAVKGFLFVVAVITENLS